MLLKYVDVLARSGQIAPTDMDEDVEVSLVEFAGYEEGKKNPVAVWKECSVVDIPRRLLFYNDTDDGSNTFITSWQRFFCSGNSLSAGNVPVLGGSGLMGAGSPKWGGMAKAAIYLRNSEGFIEWLANKDAESAEKLREDATHFHVLFRDAKKANLHKEWCNKIKPIGNWSLPVVWRLSDGRALILGLDPDAEWSHTDREPLEDENIAVPESLELARFFRLPPEKSKEIVTGELHAGKGMGRNAFGFAPKIGEMSHSEYVRLLGPELTSARSEVLLAWDNRLKYPIKVTPNPDSSLLFFFPEGDLAYETLRRVIEHEREKREQFFAAMKQKRKRNVPADTELPGIIAETPNYLPRTHTATVFLANLEGSQKKKLNILGIFPSINLSYWQLLNTEFLESHLQTAVVSFCRAAITGQKKNSGQEHAPSVYNYWTNLFTAALQAQFVSILPAWNLFQRYCKAFSSRDLVQ